jgi:colicin import membrane protein
MKAGFTTSVVMHAVILGFGLVSLGAPDPLPPAPESLPVSIIPIEDLAQHDQGDEKAPVKEKSAPLPTKRPDVVADAQKVGENSVDTEAPVTPEAKPRPVEAANAPAPQPKPVEKPLKQDTPKPPEEPKPVPATEAAPTPAPRQEVKPEPVKEEPKPEPVKQPEPKPAPEPVQKTAAIDPSPKPDAVAEAIEAQQPVEQSVDLPTSAPAPEARPRPAEAQTAKAPERKAAEKPVSEASSKPKSDSTEESVEDKVAELLNKQKPSGGGAKRSTETAALGGKKKTGEKLTNSEMGALSDQLSGCWSIPAGAESGERLRVSVKFQLNAQGKLDGRPQIESSSGNRPFDESAVRAVQKCDRDGLILPAGKEDIWAEVVVNFDPTEMGM